MFLTLMLSHTIPAPVQSANYCLTSLFPHKLLNTSLFFLFFSKAKGVKAVGNTIFKKIVLKLVGNIKDFFVFI